MLLAPVWISSVSKKTPHFRGEIRDTRKHMLIRDSGGVFTNVIRTNLLDLKRFNTLDPRHVSTVSRAMNIKDSVEEDESKEEEEEKISFEENKQWNYMSLTTPHTKRQFELLLSLQRAPFPKNSSTVYKVRVFVGIPRSAENGKSRQSNSVQYVRIAETIPVTNTRSFPGSVLIEVEDRLLDPKFHARIRFDLINDDQFVSRRFEAYICSVLAHRDKTKTLHCPRIDPHVRLVIQVLPPMYSKPRLFSLVRHMAQTYRVATYTGCELLIREECAEPHVTFLVPSLYISLRAKEMRERLDHCRDRYGSLTGAKWTSWRESYFKRFEDLVERYEGERDEYLTRYRNVVPYRSSKQKKKGTEIAKRLRSVPLNLHLQLLTVAPFASSEKKIPASRRHGIISWGTCLVSFFLFVITPENKNRSPRRTLHGILERRTVQIKNRARRN